MRVSLVAAGGFIGAFLSLHLLYHVVGAASWIPLWVAASGPFILGTTVGWIVGWQAGASWTGNEMRRLLAKR